MLETFKNIIKTHYPDLSCTQIERIFAYWGLLQAENQKQNLTRVTTPEAFVDYFLSDVIGLEKSGFLSWNLGPTLDLGSGAGIPGLLYSAVFAEKNEGDWILVESESRKAQFLKSAASSLGFNRISVIHGRIEQEVSHLSCGSIVSKAVGDVSTLFKWIRKSSTWNNLVLLKGPGWDKEWEEFNQKGDKGKLKILDKVISFNSPLQRADKKIIKLVRPSPDDGFK